MSIVQAGRLMSKDRTWRLIDIKCDLCTQANHFVAALWSFTKLELLKVRTKKRHYELKSYLYLSALKQAFDTLRSLQPARLEIVTA